jgi:general secretion pathway protein J
VKGFTLVEVLIGLVLFSFILTALSSSFYGASRAWKASGRGQQDNDTRRLGDAFLRRTLQQTVPLVVIDGQNRRLLFSGSPDHLTLVAPLPAHAGGAGLYRLDLAVAETAEGRSALMLRYRQVAGHVYSENIEDASGKSLTLLPGVTAVHFSYFGAAKANVPPTWTDSWRDADRLPQFVRIDFTPVDPSRFWPSLVIPLRVRAVRGQPEFVLYASHSG